MSGISEILDNIDNLQNSETQLITRLNTLSSNPNFTVTAEITNLISQIDNLSATRVALFKSIGDQASIIQSGLANTRNDYVSQLTLLKTVEDQLAQAKANNALLINRNDTQKRLVEINTYYGKRYDSQSKLMKTIIMACVPLLVLVVLKNKSILPETLANYVIGITIAIGAFFVFRTIWDIYTRDNNNFDEYNWAYESPEAQIPTVWEYNRDNFFNIENPLKNVMDNLGVCIGERCCNTETQHFDTKKQKCIDNKTETFQSSIRLQGSVVNKYDDDDGERSPNGIIPFSYSSEYATL